MNEAHVHHGVGFIEHEILQVLQVHMALFLQINQSPGCGHHNVHAAPQLLNLAFLVDAAENGGGVKLDLLGVIEDIFFNLNGQLSGGRQDQTSDGLKLSGIPVFG